MNWIRHYGEFVIAAAHSLYGVYTLENGKASYVCYFTSLDDVYRYINGKHEGKAHTEGA